MNKIERTPHYAVGPRFFKADNGMIMFEHRIDSRSCIGPRPATLRDKEINPELWAKHLAEWTEEENSKIQKKRRA